MGGTLEFSVSNALPGRQHLIQLLEEPKTSVWPTRKGLLEACIWSPVDFASGTFSLCWYSFTVINHNHKHDYILSPMSPPSKPSKLGLILGTPHICSATMITLIWWHAREYIHITRQANNIWVPLLLMFVILLHHFHHLFFNLEKRVNLSNRKQTHWQIFLCKSSFK